MASIKTINFLPKVFRTDTNQKFLNATLDQLVTTPDLRKINSYVGRRFAPTFKSTDNYQPEPTVLRQNYQLEPSVVVKNQDNEIEFFSSYIDLLQQIKHYGGLIDDQSRLFSGESYSFSGLFDFDKFVNFNQYYWLPDGPDAVQVYGSAVDREQTFIVTRDTSTGGYRISGSGTLGNPTLKLAYGGVYKFVVNQPGYPFWIQSDAGTSGIRTNQRNMSSREVLGVENNGIDVGTITFTVPQPSAQNFYLNMPLQASVDLATELSYTQLQNQLLSHVVSQYNGIDGITSQLANKTLIFANTDIDDTLWTAAGIFDLYGFNGDELYDQGTTVVESHRRGVWRIKLIDSGNNDYIINLIPDVPVTTNQKIFVKSGNTNSELLFYLNAAYNSYFRVPNITAPLTNVFYQDGVSSNFVGALNLLNVTDTKIHVDTEMIGQKQYISPNGVTLTNGLKITFDTSVTPSSYADNTYYVEGVGSSIQLLLLSDFQTPESYADAGITTPDYLTINRASADLNSWTRSNRWFHSDVIIKTSQYNETVPLFDQSKRANRPIIEFDANLQLANFGRIAKLPVDIFDNTSTDALSTIALSTGFTINGVELADGMRIVFSADTDPTVRNKIYTVNISSISGDEKINLVPAADAEVLPYNNLIVLRGTNKGTEYYFDGSGWIEGQQKTAINQAPLFDVIDLSGNSFSDETVYPGCDFVGTKIFSYTPGSGVPDTVLGFPLSYRNFNQIGDIQFDNNFDSDICEYTADYTTVAQKINSGLLRKNTGLTTFVGKNIWEKDVEKSKQYQIISNTYNGINPNFEIDIDQNSSTTIPYFRVYVNNKLLSATEYVLTTSGVRTYVQVTKADFIAGDIVDVLIYSNAVSKLGYYEIPKNLDFNTKNQNFTNLTLGQLRNHLSAMATNSNAITGLVPGSSNLRDTQIKGQGGSIVQHASPVLYSELFLVDKDVNFIKGLDLARHEYSKIKNKILELSATLPKVNYKDTPGTLDYILTTINSVKNKNFAWYYSDMVPYGNIKNVITYTVIDAEITRYEITNIYSTTTLGGTAVLVYLNGIQLDRGYDFTFDISYAGITITKPISAGDIITIHEYSSTDGNYIPETPSKLGLYPKFKPEIFVDSTFQTPITVIRGHDGSITPAFGDFRDQLLLEFEKRIFNNINIDYQKNIFDIYNFIPGKFRQTNYTNDEFNKLLTRSFLQWTGNNKVDFTNNTYFDAAIPFTWNYKKFNDIVDGEKLVGTWRGIFNYFFDTDRPNTNPWEMLGFTEIPTWWEDRYGPAPYTGGNLVLWEDLEKGFIYAGDRAGIDVRFARPGLTNIIPVDDRGTLRSPDQFLTASYNSIDQNASFAVGDWGPVEAAWRRSSEYPFAVQRALALSNPGFYFGTLMEIGRYYYNSEIGQFVLSDSLQRISPSDIGVNGTVIGTSVYRAAGYINWIAEYLRNQGIDPSTKILKYLKDVDVQLAYKMAGYSDKSFIEVIAEQSSPTSTTQGVVVPNENYRIELYKSTPTSTVTYSAVIIEKSENGYTVSGYDTTNPYFTIIPSLANNNAYTISVLNERGVIYKDYQKYKVTVPYGFEFSTKQQIVDFLVGYERYLKAVGVSFADFDTDLNVQRDFKLSVREFLMWVQQQWSAGSVIILSPILNKLVVNTTAGVIDTIKNIPDASRLLDPNFNFIKSTQFTVTRDDNRFSVASNYNQTIGLAVLDIVEYEHILIFDNTTVFNDIIYKPELGNRQYRLKLVGSKTGSWTGNLNPPGFIYNSPKIDRWNSGTDYAKGSLVAYKNIYYAATADLPATTDFVQNQWKVVPNNEIKSGLLPNFSYNAEKFKRFHDVDNPESQGDFEKFSTALIGFNPRQYLTDFGIDNATQAKFYQGFIKEKGTNNAITAFTAAGFNGVTSTINLYEEWGFRVGEYGALENNKFVEVSLDEGLYTSDPVTFTLLPSNGVSTDQIIGVTPSNLYKVGENYEPNIFNNRDASSIYENDIHTAGYVYESDIDQTIFDLSSYGSLNLDLTNIAIGHKIWVAKDLNSNWNVFRVTETNNVALSISYNLDNIGTLTFFKPHDFSDADLLAIKGFSSLVDGFYQVYSVIDAFSVNVVITKNLDQIKSAGSLDGLGPVYKLQSSRISDAVDLTTITPLQGWKDDDKLWVDNNGNNKWAVYNKTSPWQSNASAFNNSMKIEANSYVVNSGFGTVTTINAAGTFAAATVPNILTGRVMAFVSNVTNGNVLTLVSNVGSTDANVSKFGASLTSTDTLLYVGAPGNGLTQPGRVFVYEYDGETTFDLVQTITSPTGTAGDTFGASISSSDDGKWLFVGAPNAGNVYVYHGDSSLTYTHANTITVGSSSAVQFGLTVQTTSDASQTIIGAPYERVSGVSSAGAVYIYDRSIETFIAGGGTTYTTYNPINSSTVRVVVNGIEKTTGFTLGASSVTFTNAPTVGDIISVETNKIQPLEKITAPTLTSGGTFGITAAISGNDADVYIASPGYSEPGYHSGIVHRFVNRGAEHGIITGTEMNPTVTIGSSLRINGKLVTFTGSSLNDVVDVINSANIVGVTANITGVIVNGDTFGSLTITSNVATPHAKLVITPGNNNTALSELGLTVYGHSQELRHPGIDTVDQFGSQIVCSDDAKTVIISATKGTTYNQMTIDAGETTVDMTSTEFIDPITGSGVVYVYALVNRQLTANEYDQYVLSQRLENTNLSSNDAFGTSLAMNQTTLLVGAPGDSNNFLVDQITGNLVLDSLDNPLYATNAGTYYTYNNFTSNIGWDVLREEQPQVDVRSINRMYLYNKTDDSIITNLDFIDPVKGKILGAAEQDIDFFTTYDPAIYNVANSTVVSDSTSYYWGSAQVGKTWWNLDAVRFVDYEQGTITNRANSWGNMFPGSTIKISEWVESSLPPAQYTGDGVLTYTDIAAYCVENYVDQSTKIVRQKYYFWVHGKTNVNSNITSRAASTDALEKLISNPESQGIPYATILRDDTVCLHNITNVLTSNNIILHIDYDDLKNVNVIHSEYQLVQEGNSNSFIPNRIIEKIKDSLSGIDTNDDAVPATSLAVQNRIGLGVKPNQTLFVNRSLALRNFVDYVNTILMTVPVVDEFNIDGLYKADPYPIVEAYDTSVNTHLELSYIDTTVLTSGYVVLVTHDETQSNLWATYTFNGTNFVLTSTQSYYTPFYWTTVDWNAITYDPTSTPSYIVDTVSDIQKLNLVEGNIIRVLNNGRGKFVIYRRNSSGTNDLVSIQDGTIQLNSNLYATDAAAGKEIRIIFETLQNFIFINTLKSSFNRLFFFLINYILSEQKSVDWVFKSSFISVLHQLRKLEQFPNYIKDNQTYYEDYINEVKPYRTSIREYLVDYQGSDEYHGDVTDFDLPSSYNYSTETYRSPDGSISSDDSLWQSSGLYKEWYNNHTYGIESVSVSNAGTGYYLEPMVTVVGGGGSGAVINAIVDYSTNSITRYEVVKPGSGYTSQPTLVINGTGSGAVAYVHLKNKYFIESLPTQILNIGSNATVYAGNIITQPITGAAATAYSASTGNVITVVDITGTFENGEYLFNDLANLGATISSVSSYTQFINKSYNTVRTFDTSIKFDRVSYTTNLIDWLPNITVQANTIVSYNNKAYQAKDDVYSQATIKLNGVGNVNISVGDYVTQYGTTGNSQVVSIQNDTLITLSNIGGHYVRRGGNITFNNSASNVRPVSINNVFDYGSYNELSADSFDNANDRIWAYYRPISTTLTKDLKTLVSGIEYPGVSVSGVGFNANTSVVESSELSLWANISTLYSNNTSSVNFKELPYQIGQPLSIIDTDQNQRYLVKIADITKSTMIVTGNVAELVNGANIKLEYFDYTDPIYLDTSITSSYVDSALGTRPEDINIDGGAYYDTYNSHAPEELVPGIVYDNLNMSVYTKINNGQDIIGYRIAHNMIANSASQNSDLWPEYYRITKSGTLAANLLITDSNIHVVDASVLPNPNAEMGVPGIVYINGEKITYFTRNIGQNTLGQLRRGVDGTGAAYLHQVGSTLVSSSVDDKIPNSTTLIAHKSTWLNSVGQPAQTIVTTVGDSIVDNTGNLLITDSPAGDARTDGLGLEGSNTIQALFIKGLL